MFAKIIIKIVQKCIKEKRKIVFGFDDIENWIKLDIKSTEWSRKQMKKKCFSFFSSIQT